MEDTTIHPSEPTLNEKHNNLSPADVADPPEHSNPEAGEHVTHETKPGTRRTSAFGEIMDSMKDVFGLKKKRKDSQSGLGVPKIGEEGDHHEEKDGEEKLNSKPSSRKGSKVKASEDFNDWGELYDKVQEWKEGDEGPAPEGKLKKQGTKNNEEPKTRRSSGIAEVKEVLEPKQRRASALPALFGGGIAEKGDKEVKRKNTGEAGVKDDSFDDWGNLLDKVEQWKEEDTGKKKDVLTARKMRS